MDTVIVCILILISLGILWWFAGDGRGGDT